MQIIIRALTVALMFAGFARAETTSCKPLTRLSSAEMRDVGSGLVTVPVEFESKTVPLLLSLTTLQSEVDKSEIEPLRLMPGRLEAVGVWAFHDAVLVPRLRIGDLEFKNRYVAVDPGNSAYSFSKAAGGVLGMDLLAPFDIELDFANHKLNLFLPDHCPGAVYWPAASATEIPTRFDPWLFGDTFSVKLNDKEIDAVLDTGSTSSWLTEVAAEAVFSIDFDSPGMRSVPTTNDDQVHSYVFRTLDFGGVAFSNLPLMIYESRGSIRPTLHLGMHELRKLHIFLARGQKVMYVTPAGPIAPQASAQ